MVTARAIDAGGSASQDLERWIDATQKKALLRFITCGSVDDGKSTLIGRLLHDSKLLFEDQLSALASDSRKHGTQGGALDFALLVDGLSAEREQGITIDVAYRFFATDKRKFIVADTPGHEQYTRNMVTGASTGDLAVILVDARKGVQTQTKRHSVLAKLLGIRQLVLAVNKMDLVAYDQSAFESIIDDYEAFARQAGIDGFTAIPLSGLKGDNVTSRSGAMPWYSGPSLLEHLETVPAVQCGELGEPFRMAVQWVSRPNQNFRGFAGRIASGSIHVGDAVAVLPVGRTTFIERIVTFDGDLDHAVEGQSVTLTFTDEIDCSRGDLIVSADETPEQVSRIFASLVWMSDERLVRRRSYWLKIGTQRISADVDVVRSVVDVNTLAERPGELLGLNDIGKVEIELDRAIPAVRYARNRKLGGFILVDKISHATVAAGLIEGFVPTPVKATTRPSDWIVWFIGPARTTSAAKAAARLKAQGQRVLVVDDAAIVNFPGGNRVQTAREVAQLVAAAGVVALVTVEAAPDEARPGRLFDPSSEEGEDDQWVI